MSTANFTPSAPGPTGGSRPSLLFICQVLPYPPDGGVLIRSYHTLRILSELFDVTAVFFVRAGVRPGSGSLDGAIRALSKLADVNCFPIPQEQSRWRWAWDHVRSIATGRVYTRYVYDSDSARERVTQLLGETSFDLAHIDSLDLSSFLPLLRGIPVAVAHHNIESELLQRRAAIEQSSIKSAYLRLQSELMRREEGKHAPRVALNVVVSDHDAAALRAIAPRARVAVFPNGVDTETFQPSSGDAVPGTMVFVGGGTWFPNRDALDYFLEQILPRIKLKRPDARVVWVGRMLPRDREHLREVQDVTFTGYVEDIRPYVHGASCYIVPLRVGGGTRLKILDAWAMGKPVVSTPEGCEGLATEDGVNILMGRDPEGFAGAVCRVLDDQRLAERIGRGGRQTVERMYSWNTIGARMKQRYLDIVSRSGAVPPD